MADRRSDNLWFRDLYKVQGRGAEGVRRFIRTLGDAALAHRGAEVSLEARRDGLLKTPPLRGEPKAAVAESPDKATDSLCRRTAPYWFGARFSIWATCPLETPCQDGGNSARTGKTVSLIGTPAFSRPATKASRCSIALPPI